MHKSQGFGAAETRGENLDYLDLLKDVDNKIPASLFDGLTSHGTGSRAENR
jgi:hypothetical protein